MPNEWNLLRKTTLSLGLGLFATITGLADEPATKSAPSKATFLITGLHCPPCTSTVARSLQGTKGVKSVKVDWSTQNAKVEFDEEVVSAQTISSLIASTPHMMGRGMTYGGWLAIKVEGVQDTATAAKAKEALLGVKGVAKVVVYPKQQSVGVAFEAKGSVKTSELLTALEAAGLSGKNLP